MALVMILSSALLSGCSAEENNKADNSVSTASSYEDAVAQITDVLAGKGTTAMLKGAAPDEFWNKWANERFDGDVDGLLARLIDVMSGGRVVLGKDDEMVKDLKFNIIDPEPISSADLVRIRIGMSQKDDCEYADFTEGYWFSAIIEMTVEDSEGNTEKIVEDLVEESDDGKFGAIKVDGNWYVIIASYYKGELTEWSWMLDDIVNYYGYTEDRLEEYRKEAKAEVAKSSYSAVMETVNGYMTIKGEFPITITEQTTIKQVMDALAAEDCPVTTDHLDDSKLFLDYCEVSNGYYCIRTLSIDEWFELYTE